MRQVGTVPRARAYAGTRPVIVEGMIDAWPALQRWPDACGELQVLARGEATSLADVVARIRAGEDVGCDFTLMQAPWLVRDIVMPRDDITFVNLWVGGRKRTALHYDLADNLHACVRGKKRFYLIAPEEHARLYLPAPSEERRTTLSYPRLDFFAFDAARFPAAREVGYLVADLGPGDTLYLPARWFHAVEHDGDPTMAINFWWPPADDDAADSFFDDRRLLSSLYGVGTG